MKYILPTVKTKGYVHLGLGARLYSENPERDLRTLANATYQHWSLLTLIALTKIMKKIKDVGYGKDILPYSTIHDEISALVREDPKIIKWYNDNLISNMTKDFMENQEVPLQSNLDIGYTRGVMKELPNNCSIERIQQTLDQLKST